ncbi:MAG: hypothetical protein P8017_18195, partial [Deltaproteobacteria bacterium]
MKNIKNIDEILFEYLKAYFGLKDLITKKAKGDWGKLPLLVENDEEARQLDEQRSYYENQFREDTALGNLYTSSKGVMKAISDFLLEEQESEKAEKTSIASDLEAARDMIAYLTETGEEDDRVMALDSVSNLPNYSPDDWVRRQLMFAGSYVGEESRIPAHLKRRLEEAFYSFVYGNFFACVALARATTETALKEKYKALFGGKRITFGKLIGKCSNIKELKDEPRILSMLEDIRDAGDQIMHDPKNKIVHLINELRAKSVVQ